MTKTSPAPAPTVKPKPRKDEVQKWLNSLDWSKHLPPDGSKDKTVTQIARIMVGPVEAEMLLSINAENQRNYVPSRSEAMARDIQNGNWRVTGESLKISEGDVLMDGQHRLNAIIMSGRKVDIQLCRGLPENAFDAMDSGKVRTIADRLQTKGIGGGRAKGSVATAILEYQTKNIGGGALNPTNIEREKTIEMNLQEIVKAIDWSNANLKRIGSNNQSSIFAIFAIQNGAYKNKASDFLKQMSEYIHREITLPDESQVKILVDRLDKDKVLSKNGQHKLRAENGFMIAYAFMKFVNKETFKNFNVPQNWPYLGDFPNAMNVRRFN